MNQRVNNITYSIVPDTLGFKEMNYTVETKMGMPFMDPISEEILKPIVEYITDPQIWYYTYPVILKSPMWTKLYNDKELLPLIEIVMGFNNVSRVKSATIERIPAGMDRERTTEEVIRGILDGVVPKTNLKTLEKEKMTKEEEDAYIRNLSKQKSFMETDGTKELAELN